MDAKHSEYTEMYKQLVIVLILIFESENTLNNECQKHFELIAIK